VVIGNSEGITVRAKRVERRNPEALVAIKGPVTAVADPLIEVFGVSAVTSEETVFQDANEVPLSADDFFNAVAVDSVVEVEGILTGGNIINADEVELGN